MYKWEKNIHIHKEKVFLLFNLYNAWLMSDLIIKILVNFDSKVKCHQIEVHKKMTVLR